MACCTMQPEDGALPRGDAEGDGEVYHKNDEESSVAGSMIPGLGGMVTISYKMYYTIVSRVICSHPQTPTPKAFCLL